MNEKFSLFASLEKYSLSKLSSDELEKFSAKYQLNINF